MPITHSLENLKYYHQQAIQFFASELILLKRAQPKITDQRLGQAATLLISAGQTGAALLQLVNQIDSFYSQSVMLARSFMETIINFCYVSICDEKEYRAFVLHPIYKQYHNVSNPRMEDDLNELHARIRQRQELQAKLRAKPIVQEALSIFSDTKPSLNWTKKRLGDRIEAIESWGKVLDVFFTISKLEYYSDASEILHGSLYGSTYSIGAFEPGFDPTNHEELSKKVYRSSTAMLLHLGMLIHEAFTVINYVNDIKDIWDHSYHNRGQALNLLFFVIEKKGFKPMLYPFLQQKPSAVVQNYSVGILFKEGRFLLGKHAADSSRTHGFWDAIGGQSLENEHPIITLQRNIAKKVNIEIFNAEELAAVDVFHGNDGQILFKQHLFLVQFFQGTVNRRASEFSEFKWFDRNELAKVPLGLPSLLSFIDEWLKGKK